MTDKGTPSAGGPTELTALPLDDHFRAALALLGHAYDCAQDAHAAPWDFALEIGNLHAAGLTITDLRWLVVKGFVEHGSETSVYGDAHRSFTRSEGFNFLTTTCVVLTKKGAAFAGQVLQAAAATTTAGPVAGDEQAAPPGDNHADNSAARPQAVLKPQWDPARRELSLGGRTVKRFLVPAGNQEIVLGAFQEEGWPEHIDDPLPGNRGIDRKIRLNDVIYRLNRTQNEPLIRFHANGHGNGVHWSSCGPRTRRRRPSAAGEPIAAG